MVIEIYYNLIKYCILVEVFNIFLDISQMAKVTKASYIFLSSFSFETGSRIFCTLLQEGFIR